MRGSAGTEATLDLSAVGSGVLWGLILLLVGALALGVYDYRLPPSPDSEAMRSLLMQGISAAVAGFYAGRRARRGGVLNGALAGLGLVLSAAMVMGVLTELPGMVGLSKALAVGLPSGAIFGIAAVNLQR